MKTQTVLFAQIAKVDEAQRLVHGRAAQEVVDRSGEIFDYATSKPYFENWSTVTKDATGGQSVGNLRAMHGKVAAGKLTDIAFHDDEKAIDIVAKVVDDAEWKKVMEGVYTGFSIGGEYVKKWDDAEGNGKRYTADPSEISLVDRPCGPTSTFFKLQKADGVEVDVEFQKADNSDEEPEDEDDELTPEEQEEKNPKGKGSIKGKPADDDKKDDEKDEAEKADYEVAGTDEDVARLSKLMTEQSLTVGQVVAGLENMAKAVGSPNLAKALTDTSTFQPLVKSTFADPENYKFPLDTVDQVKAAWNFLNKDSAKAAYEPEAFTKMLDSVKGAWRDKIGTEPDDNVLAVKVSSEGTLAKGLFDITELAEVLMRIRFVLSNAVWQEKNDNAPKHSAQLFSAFETIAEVIEQMVAEEVAELKEGETASKAVTSLSDSAKGLFKSLEKIGARNSKSDAEKIQSMHDNSVALGATCAAEDAEKHDHGELAKGDTALNKALGLVETLTQEVGALTKRLEHIESQPAPAKAVLKVVSKADDVVEEEAVVEKVVGPKGEENPVASLIKQQHQHGGQALHKI